MYQASHPPRKFSAGHPPARPTTPPTGYGQTRLDRRLKISLADLAGFGHIPWTGCRRCRTPGWAGRGPGRPGSAAAAPYRLHDRVVFASVFLTQKIPIHFIISSCAVMEHVMFPDAPSATPLVSEEISPHHQIRELGWANTDSRTL